jgi:hypothetical protein
MVGLCDPRSAIAAALVALRNCAFRPIPTCWRLASPNNGSLEFFMTTLYRIIWVACPAWGCVTCERDFPREERVFAQPVIAGLC